MVISQIHSLSLCYQFGMLLALGSVDTAQGLFVTDDSIVD